MADGARPEHADPVVIVPYAGYGTRTRLRVIGRVLEDEGWRDAGPRDRRWRNLAAFLKRMESDEVRFASLEMLHGKARLRTTSDREGYFVADLPGPARAGWNEVTLRLADRPDVSAKARVLVPPAAARFGVISDIDDTVVYSHVTRKLRMLLTVALANARTRKPFPGAAAFYRALHAGVNPVFYVSKSPWNLYVPIVEYLAHQGFPAGPLLLRNFGRGMDRTHKAAAIARLLETYPRLPFVLIGDSGEADPEIYAAIVHRWPRRVRAIYIRSVDPDPRRLAAVDRLAAEVAKTGCQLVLSADTAPAAAHAAAEGLIQPSALPAIRGDAALDATSRSKPAASSGALK